MATYFAPAERIGGDELERQVKTFSDNLALIRVLNFMPFLIVILNRYRQAVFANQALIQKLELDSSKAILGMRPGEIFQCEHSQDTPGGCGTSKYCRYCGAVKAIMDSGRLNDIVEGDCSLANFNLESIDLRVTAIPCEMEDGQYYTILIMRDISDSLRRGVLERVFFHDIRNMLAGLSLVAQKEQRQPDNKRQETGRYLFRLSDEIGDEINAQQDLLAAEDGKLEIVPQEILSQDIIHSVVYLMENHSESEGKGIVVPEASEDVAFISDPRLLRRVLLNMVKNALEASTHGDVVTIESHRNGEWLDFSVHNCCTISEEIQLQLFKRSFSTKGAGHGIGTYSMKLLTEKYLHGKIAVSSDPSSGTTFTVSYPLTLN